MNTCRNSPTQNYWKAQKSGEVISLDIYRRDKQSEPEKLFWGLDRALVWFAAIAIPWVIIYLLVQMVRWLLR